MPACLGRRITDGRQEALHRCHRLRRRTLTREDRLIYVGILAWVGDPQIGEHLLREEGEVVVDEVCHHWMAYVRPAIEGAAALIQRVVQRAGLRGPRVPN